MDHCHNPLGLPCNVMISSLNDGFFKQKLRGEGTKKKEKEFRPCFGLPFYLPPFFYKSDHQLYLQKKSTVYTYPLLVYVHALTITSDPLNWNDKQEEKRDIKKIYALKKRDKRTEREGRLYFVPFSFVSYSRLHGWRVRKRKGDNQIDFLHRLATSILKIYSV